MQKTLFAVLAMGAAAMADNPPAPSYGAPAPAASYGAPAPSPSYGQPAPSYNPVPTYGAPKAASKRNCTIDFESAQVEVCVPTLDRKCENEDVVIKAPKNEEKCFEVTSTECVVMVSVKLRSKVKCHKTFCANLCFAS